MAHPNTDVVQKGYDAFARGELDALPFADDITFNIYGNNPMAGTYKGKKEVFGFLGRVMSETNGSFRLEVHALLGDDEHTVGLTTHHGERNGKQAGYNSVHVWHVRNGQMAELFEFPQQPQFDKFWS